MNAKRPNSMRHLDDAIRRECGGNQAAYVSLPQESLGQVLAEVRSTDINAGG